MGGEIPFSFFQGAGEVRRGVVLVMEMDLTSHGVERQSGRGMRYISSSYCSMGWKKCDRGVPG